MPIEPGDLVVATATNAAGSTSEFSELVPPGVGDEAEPGAAAFRLDGVFPNPVAAAAVVRFTLPEATPVRLTLHDVLGREAAVLADGARPAGAHEVTLDGTRLAAGVYVVRLRVGGGEANARVTLVR